MLSTFLGSTASVCIFVYVRVCIFACYIVCELVRGFVFVCVSENFISAPTAVFQMLKHLNKRLRPYLPFLPGFRIRIQSDRCFCLDPDPLDNRPDTKPSSRHLHYCTLAFGFVSEITNFQVEWFKDSGRPDNPRNTIKSYESL